MALTMKDLDRLYTQAFEDKDEAAALQILEAIRAMFGMTIITVTNAEIEGMWAEETEMAWSPEVLKQIKETRSYDQLDGIVREEVRGCAVEVLDERAQEDKENAYPDGEPEEEAEEITTGQPITVPLGVVTPKGYQVSGKPVAVEREVWL